MAFDSKEKAKKYWQEYYRRNKEAVDARNHRWEIRNKEKYDKYRREWVKNHPESRAKTYQKWKLKQKARALIKYGNCCACCGENNIFFLSIDHMNGGGNKERKNLSYGSNFYSYLIKSDIKPNLQILCYNCNLGKHISKLCPHKSEKVTLDDVMSLIK